MHIVYVVFAPIYKLMITPTKSLYKFIKKICGGYVTGEADF